MSTKSIDDNVKKLMALGHSKTKAAKALKDCGNSFAQAKSLLDQTAAEKERQMKLEEKARQREKEEAERRKQEEEKRSLQQLAGMFQPNSDNPVADQPGKKIKLHPCIVQYKSCRYGKFCLLKDFPGDTCINYFHGDCIYGSACRNRHSINGVDLRHFVHQAQMEEESLLQREANGAAVYVSESLGGGVLVGERVVPEQPIDDRPVPLPQPHMWNVSAGSDPSYTDPLVESVMQQLCDDEDGQLPAPFLEKVRQPKSGPQRAPVVVVGSDVSPHMHHQPPPMPDLSLMVHPCIAQCGGCKYGDGCLHAHKRADICVFFLNGRCSFPAEQCRFRHETGAPAPAPPQAPSSPPMSFVLKSNAVIGGQSMWGLHDSAISRRELEARELERMYAPPPAMSQLSSPLPYQAPPTSPFSPLHTAYGQPPARPPQLTKEDEQSAFEALHSVFPSVAPSLLLHCIRQANGDRQQVANMIVSFPSTPDLQRQLDSLLDAEGTAKEPDSATNVLLTLCHLFPHVEVSVIEGALRAADGDYGEAYYTLLCSAEHVTHDKVRDWSADASASDQLKLHKLYAMFSDLPKEVVDACFAQSGSNTPASIEVLNQLASGALTDEERQQRGAESTTSTFVVTSPSQKPVSSTLREPALEPTISQSQLYLETAKEVGDNCDWRRVRQEAYAVNKCRIRLLCHASAAYHRGDGKTAKILSRNAQELRAKYEKLNMLAMHALERERQGESLSTLDLHGFHVDEAVDVLRKRLNLCASQHVRRVRIVVGEGRHSSKGQSTVYPAVYAELQRRPHAIRIASVRPAYMDIELVPGSL